MSFVFHVLAWLGVIFLVLSIGTAVYAIRKALKDFIL